MNDFDMNIFKILTSGIVAVIVLAFVMAGFSQYTDVQLEKERIVVDRDLGLKQLDVEALKIDREYDVDMKRIEADLTINEARVNADVQMASDRNELISGLENDLLPLYLLSEK